MVIHPAFNILNLLMYFFMLFFDSLIVLIIAIVHIFDDLVSFIIYRFELFT